MKTPVKIFSIGWSNLYKSAELRKLLRLGLKTGIILDENSSEDLSKDTLLQKWVACFCFMLSSFLRGFVQKWWNFLSFWWKLSGRSVDWLIKSQIFAKSGARLKAGIEFTKDTLLRLLFSLMVTFFCGDVQKNVVKFPSFWWKLGVKIFLIGWSNLQIFVRLVFESRHRSLLRIHYFGLLFSFMAKLFLGICSKMWWNPIIFEFAQIDVWFWKLKSELVSIEFWSISIWCSQTFLRGLSKRGESIILMKNLAKTLGSLIKSNLCKVCLEPILFAVVFSFCLNSFLRVSFKMWVKFFYHFGWKLEDLSDWLIKSLQKWARLKAGIEFAKDTLLGCCSRYGKQKFFLRGFRSKMCRKAASKFLSF